MSVLEFILYMSIVIAVTVVAVHIIDARKGA